MKKLKFFFIIIIFLISARVDLTPLSSSLLADWLDVTGNISQADLDALEQDFSMQSPMAVFESEYNASSNSGAW